MTKKEAIALLVKDGWTKADAQRALQGVDFAQNPNELIIRQCASNFAGQELYNRQRLQAAQKAMVTKRSKTVNILAQENKRIVAENQQLKQEQPALNDEYEKLKQINLELQKDNKALQTYINQIQLRLALDVKKLLKFEDSEIRKELVKWFARTQG